MADKPATRGRGNARTTLTPAAGPAAARHVDDTEHIAVNLPLLGEVRLPPPQQLAYYGAIGALLALEIIDWPIALLVTAGHALATQQHSRAIQEFGAGLEQARD